MMRGWRVVARMARGGADGAWRRGWRVVETHRRCVSTSPGAGVAGPARFTGPPCPERRLSPPSGARRGRIHQQPTTLDELTPKRDGAVTSGGRPPIRGVGGRTFRAVRRPCGPRAPDHSPVPTPLPCASDRPACFRSPPSPRSPSSPPPTRSAGCPTTPSAAPTSNCSRAASTSTASGCASGSRRRPPSPSAPTSTTTASTPGAAMPRSLLSASA